MAPKMGLPWTNQSISTLIENYSQQNCLYDTKLTLYHNKNIRQKTLEDIALALESRRPNTTWQEVKVKIASLRTQFRVEHNKVKSSLKSGTSTDDVCVPALWYYNDLLFLQKHITPRKSIETLVSQLYDIPKCKEVQWEVLEIDDDVITVNSYEVEDDDVIII